MLTSQETTRKKRTALKIQTHSEIKKKTEEVKFTLKNRRFSRSCPQVGHFVER